MPQKFGQIRERLGTTLYPGFSNTVPANAGRIQRIEKGSQRIQRGQIRPTSGNYTRLPADLLIPSGGQTNQRLNLSTTAVKKIGGVSIAANTSGFAYTSTTSSITWYWDGSNSSHAIVITRADGSRFTVPTGGSGLTVTGLTLNTTYYFLPFWNVNNLCNIGWVPGTVGSPQIAFVVADTQDLTNSPFYLMQQTTQGNEPLSTGYMSAATTASGSGGGGAGGGGGGGHACVMAGTEIETLGDLPYELQIFQEFEWVHLVLEDRRYLNCTHDHPLFHAERGKVPADELMRGDLVITDRGEMELKEVSWFNKKCSKHKVIMGEGHLFWANGFLSHNFKPVWGGP